MKVRNSLRRLKARDPNCQVIKRGRYIYIRNKKNPRYNVRQGYK